MKLHFSFGRASTRNVIPSSEKITVINCGYYKDVDEDITIERQGRYDYQILYVVSGSITASGTELNQGEFYLYLPKEAQKYTYHPDSGNCYYWLHFGGKGTSELLGSLSLKSGKNPANGRKSDIDELFRLLVRGTTEDKGPSDYSTALLTALLMLLAKKRRSTPAFMRAKEALEDTEAHCSLQSLADIYKMTEEHFIRSFKASYGVSPAKYRSQYRLSHAKELLSSTSLKISEVARHCGYSDPLYFSRLFKKETAMSPSEYREKEREY